MCAFTNKLLKNVFDLLCLNSANIVHTACTALHLRKLSDDMPLSDSWLSSKAKFAFASYCYDFRLIFKGIEFLTKPRPCRSS